MNELTNKQTYKQDWQSNKLTAGKALVNKKKVLIAAYYQQAISIWSEVFGVNTPPPSLPPPPQKKKIIPLVTSNKYEKRKKEKKKERKKKKKKNGLNDKPMNWTFVIYMHVTGSGNRTERLRQPFRARGERVASLAFLLPALRNVWRVDAAKMQTWGRWSNGKFPRTHFILHQGRTFINTPMFCWWFQYWFIIEVSGIRSQSCIIMRFRPVIMQIAVAILPLLFLNGMQCTAPALFSPFHLMPHTWLQTKVFILTIFGGWIASSNDCSTDPSCEDVYNNKWPSQLFSFSSIFKISWSFEWMRSVRLSEDSESGEICRCQILDLLS